MYRFKTVLCILLVFTIAELKAQDTVEPARGQYKNSIQAEAFGGAYIYSLNYERLLFSGPKFSTAGQTGLALWGSHGNLVTVLRVDATELIGAKTAKFELGFGAVFINERSKSKSTSYWDTLFAFRLGLRLQNPDKRMLYRISFTPLYGAFDDIIRFFPWGGLSIGYRF